MKPRDFRRLAALLIALVLSAPGAGAQQNAGPDSLHRLPAALGASARATILALVDSVGAAGLPTTPLVDKAAEGALKGADDARIVAAVRELARDLGEARRVLGSADDPALLGAMASALRAGIPEPALHAFAHPARGPAPSADALESALVTVVDLVAKRVTPAAAASSIRTLLDRHAGAAQFTQLRMEVDEAIRAGQSPAAALDARTRAHLRRLDTPPGGGPPPL